MFIKTALLSIFNVLLVMLHGDNPRLQEDFPKTHLNGEGPRAPREQSLSRSHSPGSNSSVSLNQFLFTIFNLTSLHAKHKKLINLC